MVKTETENRMKKQRESEIEVGNTKLEKEIPKHAKQKQVRKMESKIETGNLH